MIHFFPRDMSRGDVPPSAPSRLLIFPGFFYTVFFPGFSVFLSFILDLAVSSVSPPPPPPPPLRMYLPKGLRSRLECPATSNPPLTFVVWVRNGTIVDRTKAKRFDVDVFGTLTIDKVLEEDEGLYTCTPYSPLDRDYRSISMQVFVKGKKDRHLVVLSGA